MKTKKIHLLSYLDISIHFLQDWLPTHWGYHVNIKLGHCQINIAAHYISGHVHLFIILYSLYIYVSVQVYSMWPTSNPF